MLLQSQLRQKSVQNAGNQLIDLKRIGGTQVREFEGIL